MCERHSGNSRSDEGLPRSVGGDMVLKPVLVFDMDGVLVDVSESYRATIVETVRHFSGKEVAKETIQDYKNQGGWNNDWALSQRLIADVSGMDVPYDIVVEVFQSFFFGPDI